MRAQNASCGAYSSLDAAPFTAVAASGSLPTPPVSKCVRFLRMNTLEFVKNLFEFLGESSANLGPKIEIETLGCQVATLGAVAWLSQVVCLAA